MIIAGIILSVLLGVGGLIYLVDLGSQTPAIVETILAPFTLAVNQFFTLLGGVAPLLVAMVPLYFALNAENPGEDRNQIVAYSAIYGLALYGLAVFTGVDVQLAQAMRGSFFVGSTIGVAVSTLGSLAYWVTGLFTGLLLWGTGLILVVLGGALDVIVGVGEAARRGRRGVKGAQRSILDRIGGKK